MNKRKYFKNEGIKYSPDMKSYVHRISDVKEPTYARFTMDETLGNGFGNFTKPTQVTRLGWGSRNPEKKSVCVATFNMPEDGGVYKVVYDSSWNRKTAIIKVFSAENGEQWKAVASPPKNVMKHFFNEFSRLTDSLNPGCESMNREVPTGRFR